MATIRIDGQDLKFSGTIIDFILSLKMNPDSFLFLIDGIPVPSDTELSDDSVVKAIRVASGG